MNKLDDFILQNDTWLKYMPILITGLIMLIIIFSIVIGFLVYRRYKNQNLKSRNRKSDFAVEYSNSMISNASSSAPLKRAVAPPAESGNGFRAAVNISDRPKKEESRILEFYFEYEDEYRI